MEQDTLQLELGNLVTGRFYEFQELRKGCMGRIRNIIFRKMTGLELRELQEKKKKSEEEKKWLKEFVDKNIPSKVKEMRKLGKITAEDEKYLEKMFELLNDIKLKETQYKKLVEDMIVKEKIFTEFSDHIKGLGPLMTSMLLYYFAYCEKAKYPSSLWKFTGLFPGAKFTKGESAGFNPKARTMCLPKGTRVLTEDGFETIENIKVNDRVLSHDNKFNRVSETFINNINEKLVNIIPYYGNLPLTITEEHPLLAIKLRHYPNHRNSFRAMKRVLAEYDDNLKERLKLYNKAVELREQDFSIRQIAEKIKVSHNTVFGWLGKGFRPDNRKIKTKEKYKPKWVSAKELEKGDIILYPKIKHIEYPKELVIPKIFGEINKIPSKIKVDEEFCKLIGFFAGNGHTVSDIKRSDIGITINTKDISTISEVIRLMTRKFDLTPKFLYNKEKSCVSIIYYSKNLKRFFREHYGISSHTKKIPNWFLTMPLNLQKAFLKGYYLTDGLRNPKGSSERFGWKTVSKELAYNLRQMFINIGIFFNLSYEYEYYRGRTSSSMFEVLNVMFDRNEKPKVERTSVWQDDNYFYVRIKHIKRTIKKKITVYNLEVENSNSYTAEGIIVHNCWKIGDSMVKQRSPRYRPIYDKEKARQISLMENEAENMPSCLGHADARARRKMVKHLLVDYYVMCKTLTKQPMSKPYVIEKLGHKHFDDIRDWIKLEKLRLVRQGKA